MKGLGWIKKITQKMTRFDALSNPNTTGNAAPADHNVSLSDYEIRRKELADSTKPIEGIFYLYQGRIICDHYSEDVCPGRADRKKHQYHRCFHHNYMRRKYPELGMDQESVPRGRVSLTGANVLYIDSCYKKNKEIIDQLKAQYRLPADITIIGDYQCDNCRAK